MYKVVILPLAKQDIKETKSWYESRSKGLGFKFLLNVKSKVNNIKDNPLSSNIRYDNIHTAVLDVFPFMIHYNVDMVDKIIVIIAVLHTSLDSEKWESRK